jgi:hypothetical protein
VILWEEWLQSVQEFCPSFVKVFSEQSQQVKSKIIELFAKHNSLVTMEDYERQKEFLEQLSRRCIILEEKINELSESKKV